MDSMLLQIATKLAESINRIPDGKIDDFLEETDRLREAKNLMEKSNEKEIPNSDRDQNREFEDSFSRLGINSPLSIGSGTQSNGTNDFLGYTGGTGIRWENDLHITAQALLDINRKIGILCSLIEDFLVQINR